MTSFPTITVHESQWPDRLAVGLRESLRTRQIRHKFHYESPKQVRRWLKVHEIHSPARRDEDCRIAYDRAFRATVAESGGRHVHLIALGCGGGQKEARLLELLNQLAGGTTEGAPGQGSVVYSPVDVGTGMVITALRAAWAVIPADRCAPLVCDLTTVEGLGEFVDRHSPSHSRRLYTFFGMIPNFEPPTLWPLLERVLRPGDLLLCSVNLAPGTDYQQGTSQVLPQYDNPETREWLLTLFCDLGVERNEGALRFRVADCPHGTGLLRIEGQYEFRRDRHLDVEGEQFSFTTGERVRLFFSYRHTAESLQAIFEESSLQPLGTWSATSGEEAIQLFCRT